MAIEKVRTIYTNDGECDDMNTFLHEMLYLNDMELEGIVYSCSKFHYEGIPEKGIAPMRWAPPDWMYQYIDAYEKVYPALTAHDLAYPTPDYLRSVTAIGNIKMVSEMEEVTPGSELIRKAICREDPRKLYIQIGGGTSTVARALKSIEESYAGTAEWEQIYRTVSEKIVIVMIFTQDDTYGSYISKAWPDIKLIHCTEIMPIAFGYGERNCPPEALECFCGKWIEPHILKKGEYGSLYHTWRDGHRYPGEEWKSQFGVNDALGRENAWGLPVRRRYDMISEGDSPAFLYLLDRGLRSLEDPSYGGWGGRYERLTESEYPDSRQYYRSCADKAPGEIGGTAYATSRWICDWMNDFAARLSWTQCTEEEKVNHRPIVEIKEGLDIPVYAGEQLTLHAKASCDAGDTMTLHWWCYEETGICRAPVVLQQAQKEDGSEGIVSLVVPSEAQKGDTIHLILTCKDAAHGEFPAYMTTYARVILTVGGE